MKCIDKFRWDIQRRSFCNRGVWRCINELCEDMCAVEKYLGKCTRPKKRRPPRGQDGGG